MKIGEMIPYQEYKKLQDIAAHQLDAIKNMSTTLERAKGILDSRITGENIRNAVDTLESLPNCKTLYPYTIRWIKESAKKDGIYAKYLMAKCKKDNRPYKGVDGHNTYFTFEAFREAAIKKKPTTFTLRFRDALISYILDQQKQFNSKTA